MVVIQSPSAKSEASSSDIDSALPKRNYHGPRQNSLSAEQAINFVEFRGISCREIVQLAGMAENSRSRAYRQSFINKLCTGGVD
jgi:hypothetical protein